MAYDTDSKAPKEADALEELKILKKMQEQFKHHLDHPTWIAARKDMIRCHAYRESEQWTPAEKAALDDRHQPETVNNLVAASVNKLVGNLVDQKVRIGFRGRSGAADEEIANVLSDIFLYIRQSNDLEFEERDMADDGFTCGMGVMDVFVEFDDLYQPEIKVRSGESELTFPDPDAKRYDWNQDANYIVTAKWLGEDEAKERYPKAKGAIEALLYNNSPSGEYGGQLAEIDSFRGDVYVDQKQKRIRIFETQYKKFVRECIYLTATGDIIQEKAFGPEKKAELEAAGIAFEKLERVRTKICVALWGAGILIDHKVTERKYFSKVPYFSYRKRNGAPYSLFTLALSMQDAINKRESKSMHLLNSSKIIGERGVLGDPAKVAEENAKPDGVVILEDGALQNNRVKIENNLELSVGHANMYNAAVQGFYNIIGINPNTFQETGEIRSGKGLKEKFSEANKPIAALYDNLRRSRKILGRVLLDFVQAYYTQQKVFMVTDNPQAAAREVTVSAEKLAKIKVGIYDVVVDDFEDSATLQQEQYNLFIQYLPQILPLGPFWVKKIIGMSDMREKDQLVKELDAQQGPPPIIPRVSVQANINELSPMERATFYDMMGKTDVAEAVRGMQLATTTETKITADISKEMIKANNSAPKEE